MAVSITSPTPTPAIESVEKRQPIYAPVETYEPVLDVLAGSAADALKERASDADNRFDSLLCATLKALKGENPDLFTSLLQSCTSLTDSSSNHRTRSLEERNVVARASDAGDSFDSLLCATLKALKGENPGLFTGLLQSCTSLIDSGPSRRMRTIERTVVADKRDFATDDKAIDRGSSMAILGRSDVNLPEKRQSEGFDTLR